MGKRKKGRAAGQRSEEGGAAAGKRPQDKGRHVHPVETSSWQEEVKHFDYKYTASFRVVPPYRFEFGTSIKARWIGQPLLQVFSQEFPYFEDSVAYYTNAMKVGRLRVNDEVAPLEYRCRDGDVITHHVHRHEPPVTSHKVRILSDSGDLLVVDKPPSLPCHPGGRYRRNSLLAILAKEHQLFDLHTVHRLDRLTSGLLLIGKNKQVAEKVRQEFEQGSVKKMYLARVLGQLPPGRTLVDQPIACKSHREAIHCIREEDGKPSQTAFTSLATGRLEDGSLHSLVLCEPLTGRTHQIRLHLQWLGCPIANDPLYGPAGVGSTSLVDISDEASAAGEGPGVAVKPPAELGGMVVGAVSGNDNKSGDGGKCEGGVGAKRSQHVVAAAGVSEGEACGEGEAGAKRLKSESRWAGLMMTEDQARNDEELGLEKNGWFDDGCIHCQNARAEGCLGYYVPGVCLASW